MDGLHWTLTHEATQMLNNCHWSQLEHDSEGINSTTSIAGVVEEGLLKVCQDSEDIIDSAGFVECEGVRASLKAHTSI